MADRVGQQLGNYRLIHLLGYGGFAEVYLGEHVYLKNQAAIKVLHTRLAKDELESFLVEGRTLVRLIHPHIVRLLEFGVEGNTPFLVMDYAPNGSLRQHYAKGSILPLSTIIVYVRQISDALQYAHNEKIIHRDVKPANMLIGRQNEVLLSDFGTAIVTQSSRYEGAQVMAGTVAYMAPEQIESHPRPASDQYSLGVVIYEWLSGDRPFQGSFTEVIAKHAFTPPPPLREKIPSISPAVEQVVLTALEKDPSRRFATIKAFALALEQSVHSMQSYPSNFPSSLPDESMLSTVISPLLMPAQPPGAGIPPTPSWQTSDPSTPSPVTDLSSLAPTKVSPVPVQPQQGHRRSSRLPIIAWLLVLLVVVLVIIGLVFSPILLMILGRSATPTTGVSPPPGGTQPPIVYPNIAGNYIGTVHNTLSNEYSNITLTMNQNQGSISGQFTVVLPLKGTGPFRGTIDSSKNIQFLVVSSDTIAPILFKGTVLPDSSISGTYCSVTPDKQCDPTMGRGTWNATKQ
jgi:serine/threonine protein kinase